MWDELYMDMLRRRRYEAARRKADRTPTCGPSNLTPEEVAILAAGEPRPFWDVGGQQQKPRRVKRAKRKVRRHRKR